MGGEGRAQAHLTITFPFPIRTNSDSALHTSVMNPNPQDAYLGTSQGAAPPSRRSGECSHHTPLSPVAPHRSPPPPSCLGTPGPLPPLEDSWGGVHGALSLHSGVMQEPPTLLCGAGQCPPCPHVLLLTVVCSLAGFLDGDADSKGEHLPTPTSMAPSPARTPVPVPSLQSAKSQGSGWDAGDQWPGTPLWWVGL